MTLIGERNGNEARASLTVLFPTLQGLFCSEKEAENSKRDYKKILGKLFRSQQKEGILGEKGGDTQVWYQEQKEEKSGTRSLFIQQVSTEHLQCGYCSKETER